MDYDDGAVLFIGALLTIGMVAFAAVPPVLRRLGYNVREFTGDEVGAYVMMGVMAFGAVIILVFRPVEFFAIVGVFAVLHWLAKRGL